VPYHIRKSCNPQGDRAIFFFFYYITYKVAINFFVQGTLADYKANDISRQE